MEPEAKMQFSCPAWQRHRARAAIAYLDLQSEEFKGILRSSFVVRGTNEKVRQMLDWVLDQKND